MNMRDCKRLKAGAIVTESYGFPAHYSRGIVLHKEYVEEEHRAKVLGGTKQARWDIYVHWLKLPKYRPPNKKPNPEKVQCWEVKLVKNGV